jgi:MFS family permease
VNLGSIAGAQQLLNLADPGGFVLFVLSSVLVSLALVPVSLTASSAPTAVPTDRMSLGELYTNSPLAVVGAFAIGLANGAMWGLIPLASIQTGYTTADIATFMSVVVLGGVALQWPVGRLSDMLDRRHVIIMAATVMCAVSVALYIFASGDRNIALALAFILGGMNLVIYPLCAAHINDRITQEDVIQANAALLLVLGVGAASGPLIGGLVMDGFGPLSLYLYMAGVAALFVMFALYRLRVSEPVPESEQVAFEPVTPAPTTPVMDPRIDPEDIELA